MAETVEPTWTVDDVAAYLRVPKATLYQWRWKNYGPPAARVGRGLRYVRADVEAWFAAQFEVA
ncbi:helix-turn-helix transcriptional regulator [Jiangella anatolica]|uniref:Excisionase n=1 Tax=Jiangella anatolica TaxID=2670374 RepID=A0A2W2BMP0_9ACTN|nr:helix-turn-helix domain-containing protein [Jiangella anatolica]PZF81594.1 excisionase [Jiangella anatolica]